MKRNKSKTHRSGFEELFHKKFPHMEYEREVLNYIKPVTKHKYTPDFFDPNTGTYYETKGRLDAPDRKKMLYVTAQHPDKRIVMVFENPNVKLTKRPTSKTYAQWCERNGIEWTTLKELVGEQTKST